MMSTPTHNKATVCKRIEEEWKGLDIELCRSLLDLMPEKLEKCLRAKGGHFN